MAVLSHIIDLVASGTEKHTWRMQQFADGKNDHQHGNQCQMDHKQRGTGQRLQIKKYQTHDEFLDR
jgi:hypothetical protein